MANPDTLKPSTWYYVFVSGRDTSNDNPDRGYEPGSLEGARERYWQILGGMRHTARVRPST